MYPGTYVPGYTALLGTAMPEHAVRPAVLAAPLGSWLLGRVYRQPLGCRREEAAWLAASLLAGLLPGQQLDMYEG